MQVESAFALIIRVKKAKPKFVSAFVTKAYTLSAGIASSTLDGGE
jgi:hypothetical protein